jgi:hypothetical protein
MRSSIIYGERRSHEDMQRGSAWQAQKSNLQISIGKRVGAKHDIHDGCLYAILCNAD